VRVLPTLDLVALSLLSAGRARGAALLTALAAPDAPALPGSDTLVAMVEWLRPGRDDAAARARVVRNEAEQALSLAARAGVGVMTLADPGYPASLRTIAAAPVVLWFRGEPRLADAGPCVAVVGSRASSPYGEEAAASIARDLAQAGIGVVSGLARGCDAAAHRAALDAGGPTVAVLGCGVDVVYPAEHRALHAAIGAHGLILSEFPPGMPPLAANFPQRNRIISGLARIVVVVEASERSGSLITARCAADQGRDVMAVPGSIFSDRARGCHALLRDGAGLAASGADVLAELGMSSAASASGPAPAEARILQQWPVGEDADLDTIALRVGASPASLLPGLLQLELGGWVRRVPGGRFVRSRR
jgi:DNA processing protein